MRFGGWLAGLILALAASPACAAEEWRDTCADRETTAYGACLAQFSGGPSAKAIVDHNAEMIRVVVDHGTRIVDPIVVIEYILPKKGPAKLTIRDPTTRGFSRSYRLPRGVFERVRTHLLGLRERGAPLHRAEPRSDLPDRHISKPGEPETVCLDGPSGIVEAVLDGKITGAWLAFCGTKDHSLVELMLTMAEPIDPICAKLPAHQQPGRYDAIDNRPDRRLARARCQNRACW